ncbi:MAG: hypothetical protein ACREUT_18595 [Steroidobacteraceae bacterium]
MPFETLRALPAHLAAALIIAAPVSTALICSLGAPGEAIAADGLSGSDAYVPHTRETGNPITDRVALRISYTQATAHTTLRVDPSGVPNGGTTVSGERDLGLPSSNPDGRVELMVRMGERNRLRVDYLQLDRTGDALLNRTIIFGNQTFLANGEAASSLNWKTMGFTDTYAFVQTRSFEAGAGLGVHLISADATGSVPALYQSHQTSEAGAFPSVALDMMWRISSRFAFTGRGQYFGATAGVFSGSFGEYHGDFQYRWRSPLAIGIGYSYTRASFQSVSHEGTPGRFVLSLAGPELFVRVSF